MSRPLRLGIIGFGRFAERTILPAVRASGVAEVVALQKRSLDEARSKARQYDVPLAFDRVEDLVRSPEVDAVFIVSANVAHKHETLAAAAAGKHVLVEKPMAAAVEDAEAMVGACRAAGVQLMVGHMVRLSPVVVRLKQLAHDGTLGDPLHCSTEFFYDHRQSHRRWMFDRQVAGGGPVHDIGVHCLDTIRFILDDEVTRVAGVVSPEPSAERTETTAATSFLFSHGSTASIYCSFGAAYRRSFIEIRGSRATASAYDFTRSGQTVHLHVVYGREDQPSPPVVEPIVVPDLYADEIRRFAACVRGTGPNPVPGEEGLVNQRLLDRMLRGS